MKKLTYHKLSIGVYAVITVVTSFTFAVWQKSVPAGAFMACAMSSVQAFTAMVISVQRSRK